MLAFMNPEFAFFGGILACAIAFVTLLLTGRSALSRSLAGRLDTLETQIADRTRILQEMGRTQVQNELLSNRADHLEKRLEALQQEIKPIEEKHLKAITEYEDVKGKLRQTKEEWSQLTEKIDVYKARIAQLDTLEENIKELIERRNQIDRDLESFSDRRVELEKILQAIDRHKDQLEQLDQQIKLLEQTISKKNEQLQQTEAQILKTDEDLRMRKDELNRLEKVKIELDAKVETLAEKLKSVGKMPPEAFTSLEIPVFGKKALDSECSDEQEALNDLNRMVDYCGYEIPVRLQNAFHTALKTSDISCLTVMAGVSGTGKSAFPKLYAEAMGMYFLPLAVEPRWDSPQDLFGFLNYMENRFEATSLGRALMQFNNSPHADPKTANMRDRLLIVLLDEMNLARIEYYFSEFLSKLEMRRNADLQREQDYRMVSVEVFSGQADENGRHSPAIRLYAGSNVLFVGTMNEDESTQSLSDKVIDRANVLYFGRPNKLRDKHQQVTENSEWRSIRHTQWRSWVIAPGPHTIPEHTQIDRIINNLNQVLSHLGRPFGWRTYKAIKAYIANHPAVRFRGDSGLLPLADQIAMRVMPKLRGLDINEHGEIFSALGQILTQLNDSDLKQAFDRAAQHSQGFFDWRGINWES